jgi:hypothetical protein
MAFCGYRTTFFLSAVFLAAACFQSGAAGGLQAGEYACAGSSGTILIGLGFKLRADGTYTDLDGRTSGKVTYSGSNVTFVGGHLAGQVGHNITGGTSFQIGGIGCSLAKSR